MYLRSVCVRSESFPSRDLYPFNVPALQGSPRLTLDAPVVFFVGENGSGKTTLLEAIVRRCGLHIWARPKRHAAHRNPHEAGFSRHVDVAWVNGPVPGSLFSAETFHEWADFLDDIATLDPGQLKYAGGQMLNTLSHGQGLMAYFAGRYRYRGLYFLDEPEAALSPATQVKLLRLLQRLPARGQVQFIIATHSPILLAVPGAQIFSFDGGGIAPVTYEETAHFRLFKAFLTDYKAFLD